MDAERSPRIRTRTRGAGGIASIPPARTRPRPLQTSIVSVAADGADVLERVHDLLTVSNGRYIKSSTLLVRGVPWRQRVTRPRAAVKHGYGFLGGQCAAALAHRHLELMNCVTSPHMFLGHSRDFVYDVWYVCLE